VFESFSPCAAAAFWRRDAILAAGGFEERFFCYGEDVELGFRLRLQGGRCLQVADAIVHHVGSASTGKRSAFATYHGIRNLTWTVAKCLPPRLAWTVPLHLALQILQVLLAWRRGVGAAALKGLWHGLTGAPAMLRGRPITAPGAVQATVRAMTWRLSALVERGPPRP
jgi:GT2 family glycosyltransferase